ncbi:AfsR/SARP family transcriptional regulator [Amycolatopsis silviterrae]|uniref:BTAD domain-containing putative transcriptional regulator n=1 Tax=Amycolatopsis silviterrae TaxID=1656914 RepID=A0ABW5HAH3_9PSEU
MAFTATSARCEDLAERHEQNAELRIVGQVPVDRPRPAENSRVRFSLLGSLQVWKGVRDCTPKAPKVLQVLALLLVRANQVVGTDSLIRELWGEDAPRSALTTLQTYVSQLRRLIEQERLAGGDEILITRSPGYLLRVGSDQLDLRRFDELRQRGRRDFAEGRFADAAVHLRSALELWAETPLANIKLGPHLSAYAVDLQEQRRDTLQLAIESEMELGRHRELIAELRSLAARYASDEWFCRQLMRALDSSGRRGDALVAYQELRTTLRDELGIDPSRETEAVYRQLLE